MLFHEDDGDLTESRTSERIRAVRAKEHVQSLGAPGSKASRSQLGRSRSPWPLIRLALRSQRRRLGPFAPLLHSEPPLAAIAIARTKTTARAANSTARVHP